MNMFTSTKVQFSVNHSSKLDQMLREFSESLYKFEDEQRSYIEKINRLNDIRVYKDDLFELISGWTALKPQEVKLVAQGRHHGQKSLEGLSTRKINIINGISNAYDIECFGGSANGMNIQGVGENGFGLLNTITHYYTHNRDKSITDLFFGDFGTKEQQTIKFAEQLA